MSAAMAIAIITHKAVFSARHAVESFNLVPDVVPKENARTWVREKLPRAVYQLGRHGAQILAYLQEDDRQLVDVTQEGQVQGEELDLRVSGLRQFGLHQEDALLLDQVRIGLSPPQPVGVCEHDPLIEAKFSVQVQAFQFALHNFLVGCAALHTRSLIALPALSGEGSEVAKFRPFESLDLPKLFRRRRELLLQVFCAC